MKIASLAVLVPFALACGSTPQHNGDGGTQENGADSGNQNAPANPAPPSNCGAPPAADAGTVAAVVQGNTTFAANLFTQLAKEADGGNLFFSPYSVSAALAMTYAGAEGQTATQMEQVLGLPGAAQDIAPAEGALACKLSADGAGADGGELDIANGLFGQQGKTFEPPFLSLLSSDFGAGLQYVDFRGNPDGARQAINQWVSNQTRGMIPDLLPPGTITSDDQFALADALYFTALWAGVNGKTGPFDPALTQPANFTTPTGTVQAPMMQGDEPQSVPYFHGLGVAAIEMTFQDQGIAMDFFLPDSPTGLPALEALITPATLQTVIGAMTPTTVNVQLPKLNLDTKLNLVSTLQAMGLTNPFDSSQADFSGMDGQKDLFIGLVQHEAVLKVYEAGATAAAATVVAMVGGASPQNVAQFVADHPFLLLIRDVPTGTILFAGQVTDPTKN